MSRYHLGEFEEVVLLTIGVLYGNAYGITILDEIEERLNRNVSIGSLQTVLRRLEKKGYLTSEMGESTPERGGKESATTPSPNLAKKYLRKLAISDNHCGTT